MPPWLTESPKKGGRPPFVWQGRLLPGCFFLTERGLAKFEVTRRSVTFGFGRRELRVVCEGFGPKVRSGLLRAAGELARPVVDLDRAGAIRPDL